MKKTALLTLLLSAALFITGLSPGLVPICASGPPPPVLEAETAILIDQASGKILYAQNADKTMYPASTTKILTALLAVESGDLTEIVTIGNEVLWIPWDSSKAGFDVGDQITLEELVYGLMLPSGNDAAYTIAVHLARRQALDPELPISAALKLFAEMMNQRARQLGAVNSNFTVPDGYHDDNHYTTARDLALIAREALNHELIREVASTGRYLSKTWIGSNCRPWVNTNQLIRSAGKFYYEKATGLKTGYTGAAGFCLVSSAANQDLNLLTVVLNTSKDGRWTDSIKLLEYGWENFTWQQLVASGEKVCSAALCNQDDNQPETISLTAVKGFAGVFARKDLPRLKKTVVLKDKADGYKKNRAMASGATVTLSAPLKKGEVVGTLVFTLDGQELFRTGLAASTDVPAKPWWRDLVLPGSLTLVLGLTSVLLIHCRRKRRRHRYIFRHKRIGI